MYIYILRSTAGNVPHPEKLSYICGAQLNVEYIYILMYIYIYVYTDM